MTNPTGDEDGDEDDIGIGTILALSKGVMVERKRTFARKIRRKRSRKQDRITAVTCLLVFFTLLFVIIRRSPFEAENTSAGQTVKLRGSKKAWISEHSQPFNQDDRASRAHHLIMVAGHSVIVSGDLEDADKDENDWWLLDYQRHQGLPQAIRGHIQAGIEEADRDPDALLVFSGGETRATTGPMAESTSYFHVADAMKMWPKGSTVRARTTAEEFATDSFENLLFSICRFKEVTGSYPTKITTVSFSFKRQRFESLHAPALRFPKERFKYIGYDPPASTGFNLGRATEGESKNAASLFESDPYGCHTQILQQKRKGRNPFHRTPPYPLSCPEMKDLLSYCGPKLISKDRVPWGGS